MAKDSPKKLARQANKQAEALELQEQQDAVLAKYVAAEKAKEKAEDFLKAARDANDSTIIHTATEQMLKATEDMKAARKEWNKNFKNSEFEDDLATYEASVGTGALAAEIMAGEGTTEEKVAALRGVVETSADTRETVAILQELNDSGLSPADLLMTDESRTRAIRAVFPADEANDLINSLSLPENAPQHRAALDKLQEKHDQLQPVYERSLELIGDLNEFDEQRETQKAKELLGRLGETFAEKPLETSIATLAVIGTLIAGIAIFTKKDDLARKILLGTAVGGAALFGINFLSGALSKDGQTLAQRYLYDADNWKLENISSQFKDQLSGLTSGNEHAFQAMMHLKDAKASTLAAAFENSLRGDPGQREIDPLTFFSTREIPRSEARKINARGLYEGLEAMMVKVAIDSGEPRSENRDYLAKKGLELFKERYASGGDDIRLQYIVCDLIVGVPMLPREQRASDGSIRKGASAERVASMPSEVSDLQNTFDSFSVDMDVSHDGERYIFNGYPLDVEVTKGDGANIYQISDPTDSGLGTILLRKDGEYTENAKKISDHVKGRVKAAFAEKDNGGYTLDYDVDKHRWFVKGDVIEKKVAQDLVHITRLDLKGKVAAVMGENGFIQIRIDGLTDNYPSVNEAVEAMQKQAVHDVINEKVNYLVGKTAFEVKDIAYEIPSGGGSATAAIVEIRYSGSTAKFKFENGDITEITKFEYNEEAMRTLRDVARTQAENAMRNTGVDKHFTELSAAFAGKANYPNFMDYIDDVMARAGGRMAGDAPFFYDRRTDWEETVALKKAEYQLSIESRILGILVPPTTTATPTPAPPTPSDYQTQMDIVVKEIYAEIGSLSSITSAIRGTTLDGDALNAELLSQSEALGEFGYKSEMFKGKMTRIEEIMHDATLDWKGPDGMRTARKVRDHIRLQIFKKAMPIPGKTEADAKAEAKYESYMDSIIADLERGLGAALASAKGNISIPFTSITIDERIDNAAIDALLTSIPTYEKYAPHPTSFYGSLPTAVPGAAPSSASSGPSSRPRALQEETERALTKIERANMPAEKMQLAQDEIDRLMGPIDDLEWSVFADNFDTFLGYRKHLIVSKMRQGITANPANADALATTAVLAIETEVEQLKSFTSLEQTNDSVVLRKVMERMTGMMVADSSWAEPSKKVIGWLTGNFEFEKVAFKDKPTIFTDIMDIYYSNIGFGTEVTPPHMMSPLAMAEGYTNYFLYSAAKLLPGDKNWSIDNLSKIQGQVSETEWDSLVVAMKGIDTYEEWLKSGASARPVPELVENDTTLRIEEGVERDKAEVREEFMDWFDDNMDLSQLTRFDGNWPSLFKEHAVARMLLEIDAKAPTSEQLKRDLNKFAQFLVIEKQFYEHIINAKINDGGREYLPLVNIIGALSGPALGIGLGAVTAGNPVAVLGGMAAGTALGGFGLAALQHGGKRQYLGPNIGFHQGIKFHVNVRNIVEQEFQNNFVSGSKDPAAYAAALMADLNKIVRQAEEEDSSTYSFGPMAIGGFQGMDPFQVTP